MVAFELVSLLMVAFELVSLCRVVELLRDQSLPVRSLPGDDSVMLKGYSQSSSISRHRYDLLILRESLFNRRWCHFGDFLVTVQQE